ncbi:family 78 glycoside hydrolase catalytic domain [Mordavella massiliensis]|uniref:alpha-L-rhamnosidase n=1 Tax=Mordavella massiliensis TaxID=1871024 RepID=A0A938XBP9_9CLOT|nr:family 78 glycoside hydrolase catalytic domain [Mordavella massiliensis]MBM6948824.1 family 78 glycoside hydrolase catalytic domain [Mordavella massiliensis]
MRFKKIRTLILAGVLVSASVFSGDFVYADENENQEITVDDGLDNEITEELPDVPSDGEPEYDDSATEESDEEDLTEEKPEAEENVQPGLLSEEEEPVSDELQTESAVFQSAGEDAPYGMKINLLSKPFGVTKGKMAFTWMDADANGMQKQTAYRIVISSRIKDVYAGSYLYDTGWVESAQNTSVQYDLSDKLTDNELYYWQVQIRNEEGTESSLSEPQAFSTSVGNEWKSKNGTWGSSSQKVVMFRTDLERPQGVEKAVLSITASSAREARQYVYNLSVNGQEIGVGPVRQDGNNLYYNTYDITEYLQEGNNAIGAVNYSETDGSFLCQIVYYMEDGTSKIVTNSTEDRDTWKVKDADEIFIGGNYTSIGTSYYTARRDNLNGLKYPFGWDTAGYNAGGWRTPVTNEKLDNYYFVSSQMEYMKRYEVKPASIQKANGNTYIVDMGKEIIGGIRLHVNVPGTSTIELKYGEELNEDGSVKFNLNAGNTYKESWTLKAGEQSLYGIGMKTFRYVSITGLPVSINPENITGLMLRQEFDDSASEFTSSNQVLNDAYNLAKYTIKAASQDLYVDSQNRERVPYEGDSLVTSMSSYSFSAASTSAKASAEYLLNLDNTTWPAEYSLHNISLIYKNYMYTGDRRDLENSYQLLKEKTLEKYYDASVGLMKNVTNGIVDGQRVMTDWPTVELDGYKTGEVNYNTVFNAVCSGAYHDMACIAQILGYEDDRAYYQGLSDTIKSSLIEKLYNAETGEFYDGLSITGGVVQHSAQHATAYALAYGIYTDQAMADRMAEAIEDDGQVKMSVYGSYFLLKGLYESNHGDLARKIMSNPDSELGTRSWAYMMYGQGATITTEFWNNINKTNMSTAHAWGSSPGSMLVQGMFGIQPTSPGFETFQIKLQPGGVQDAAVKVPTLKGEISASYTLDGAGGISGEVYVPANTVATLYIPVSSDNSVLYIDGNVVNAVIEGGYLVYELPSGIHTYQSACGIMPDSSEWTMEDVVYSAYRDSTWTEDTTNRIDIRNSKNAHLEAVKLRIRNQSVSGDIQYSAYMQTYGWQDWKNNGEEAGLPGSGKRMEAFRVQLTGELAQKYDVYYKAYVPGSGWLDWACNGEAAGSSGLSREILKLQVTLVEKNGTPPGDMLTPYLSSEKDVSYETHVQSYGWQLPVGDGEISGTVGGAKRLEAIKISLSEKIQGGISYSTHVQTYGWQDWKNNGELAGTTGQAKRLEAIKIKLTGEAEQKYDVYYRVHVQTFGWLGWAKNGEPAGSEGYAKRLEGIQIRLVKKGGAAPGATQDTFRKATLAYRTHVQTYGWQPYVYDGATAGTSGQAKRLEGIEIKNMNAEVSGSILYKTHVQTYGWEDSWKKDGAMSGTSGQAKRLEAIRIRLDGKLEEMYDIYYRVHAQTYGWLDWAKNGDPAGTEGLSKRLEAIEIVLVEKGEKAPGNIICPFLGSDTKISYQTHVQRQGWQSKKYNGLVSGTSGESLRLEAIRIQLEDSGIKGGVRYKTHVQTYGWQNWAYNGQLSGTEGQFKRLEAIRIELTGDAKQKYDIYYRVHAQTYGWLGWAKNGASAGTEGLFKRLEAIQIVLVEKGGKAPGSTVGAFID